MWSNPDDVQDVIVLLGHLHITFNFFKAIGLHVENGGPDNVWKEAGVY